MRGTNSRKNVRSFRSTFSVAAVALVAVGVFGFGAQVLAGGYEIIVAQATEKVAGQGVVKGVNKEDHKLKIAHEPIPALQWPSMVMTFNVTPSVDISSLPTGAKITFTLSKGASGGYVIDEIRRAE
jgi:Cu(I)/Ag(I) efflux system protein CusF